MLYSTPPLAEFHAALDELDSLRRRLGAEVSRATPWVGRLRRDARAATSRSSTSIEGYQVAADVALAVVEGRSSPTDRDQRALAGYALAMQHVAVMADDPSFVWYDRVLLDLHFEACSADPESRPGRWRAGPILVTAAQGGVAYHGPDADQVPDLIEELVAWLAVGDLAAPAVVRAAMAHLHLVSIHPFRDGNGRLSRILQSLVLARDGVLSAELGSIEEVLAGNTEHYHAVLREVQAGSFLPQNDVTAWIAFCIDAHRYQAQERIDTLERGARRWGALEELVEGRGWPDRLVIALELGLFDGAERAAYGAEAGVSVGTASADLRRLTDAGLLVRQGKGPTTRYIASDALRLVETAAIG